MFRILLTTGRSAHQRSSTSLRNIRHYHFTVATRQKSSTASKPVHRISESPNSPSSSANKHFVPQNPPLSANNDALEAKDVQKAGHGHNSVAAEATANPITPLQSQAKDPVEGIHNVLDTEASKSVKPGVSRPSNSPLSENTPKPRKRRSPKVKSDDLGEPSISIAKKRGPKPKLNTEKAPAPAKSRTRKRKPLEEEEVAAQSPADGDGSVTVIEHKKRAKHSTFKSKNIRADYHPYLQWVRGKGLGTSMGDTRRINIVSKTLCDDVLTRLEPSLQKHIGCDIIDVNPGVGIWSEKLHNLLKPRTHILVEPDTSVYQPVLQPLIDAPGSTYQLVPKSGLVWGHMEKILSKEYLPQQEPFAADDSRLEEENNTLLFVANLGHYPKKAYKGFSSMANLVLYQFMSAIRTHSLFQRYGHVRMLIWIENDEKSTLLPQVVSQRRKAAMEAEICCEKVQEVASTYMDVPYYNRPRDLELESTRLVYEKMKKEGVTIPPGRESNLLQEIISGVPRDAREVGRIGSTAAAREELRDLESQYARGELGEWKDLDSRGKARKPNPKLVRLRTLLNLENHHKRRFERRVKMKTEYDGMFAMQRDLHGTTSPEKRRALEEALIVRTASWKSTIDDLAEDDRDATLHYLENARMFESNSPSLMWDRRDYEPLQVKKDEFVPQREMCLLDIQPKSLWPILREDFPTNYDVFEYILSQLLIIPTQTIRRGFSALAPGAYDYLIAECPSLTDPTKGGSIDVDLLTVRCLTVEMMKEIIEAWARWPFKPNRYEIMSRLGSTTYDPDAAATDGSDD